MHGVTRYIKAGFVLRIQKFLAAEGRKSPDPAPNPRFKTKEERQAFNHRRATAKLVDKVNQNFTPAGYYCTLTFDRDNECHDKRDCDYLSSLYWRRLKRAYPDAKMVGVSGKGKNTDRWHVHMLVEGIPEDMIRGKWTFGDIARIEHLREHNFYEAYPGATYKIDHGRDYTGLATYLINHWKPEYGGHRYKATANLEDPEIEIEIEPATDEMKRNGGDRKIPETPEGYIYIGSKETEYNFTEHLYVIDPNPKKQKAGKQEAATGRKQKKRQRKKQT